MKTTMKPTAMNFSTAYTQTLQITLSGLKLIQTTRAVKTVSCNNLCSLLLLIRERQRDRETDRQRDR